MTGCRTKTAHCFCFLFSILVLWATQGLYAKKKPPAHPVNLNTATAEELQQVPGIGPATAEKILQARKSYGKFKSVSDLEAIRGIGPKKLEKMRKYLTVGTPNPPNKKSTVKATPSSKTPPAKKPEAGKTGTIEKAPSSEESEQDEP